MLCCDRFKYWLISRELAVEQSNVLRAQVCLTQTPFVLAAIGAKTEIGIVVGDDNALVVGLQDFDGLLQLVPQLDLAIGLEPARPVRDKDNGMNPIVVQHVLESRFELFVVDEWNRVGGEDANVHPGKRVCESNEERA